MKLMEQSSRRRRVSGGNVILESAIVFLGLSVLLLGAFDMGQYLFVHQALVERARYAARWGAVNNPADSTSITNMVLYYQATTPSAGTPSLFNLTSDKVQVSTPDAGTDNYRLVVQISGYSWTVLSPYIAGNYTGPAITVSVPLGLYN